MHTAGPKSIADKDTWRPRLAVRDACLLGHKARYDESQIATITPMTPAHSRIPECIVRPRRLGHRGRLSYLTVKRRF